MPLRETKLCHVKKASPPLPLESFWQGVMNMKMPEFKRAEQPPVLTCRFEIASEKLPKPEHAET